MPNDSTYFERFFEELSLAIDPIQIVVGGISYFVKKIDKPLVSLGREGDAMLEVQLHDGRTLYFRFSDLQSFLVGRPWE